MACSQFKLTYSFCSKQLLVIFLSFELQGMCLYVKIFKSLYIVNAAVLVPVLYMESMGLWGRVVGQVYLLEQ